MQCSNCGFQNMPGSEVCARCSTSLQLAAVAMDVHPPRAGKFAKKMRRIMPVDRMTVAVRGGRDAIDRKISSASDEYLGVGDATLPAGLLWRMLIPGWAHFHVGLHRMGHLYLWSFVSCLATTLLWFGTITGSICLGFLIALHIMADVDVLDRFLPIPDHRQLWNRRFFVAGVVLFLLYLPIGAIVFTENPVRVVQFDTPLLHEGDVVWVDHWHTRGNWAKPGMIVLYQIEALYAREVARHAVDVIDGEYMDRVLAVAGDRVSVDGNGHLVINGKLSPIAPLNPTQFVSMSLTVPDNNVFIIPSTMPAEFARRFEGGIDPYDYCCIPRDQLIGRVYWRSQPLSRFGPIQ